MITRTEYSISGIYTVLTDDAVATGKVNKLVQLG